MFLRSKQCQDLFIKDNSSTMEGCLSTDILKQIILSNPNLLITKNNRSTFLISRRRKFSCMIQKIWTAKEIKLSKKVFNIEQVTLCLWIGLKTSIRRNSTQIKVKRILGYKIRVEKINLIFCLEQNLFG